MSHRIPDAEYLAIKESWRRAPASEPPLTNAKATENCHANVKEACQRERSLRELYQSLMPGDARLLGGEDESPLWLQIHTAVGDQKHWREMLTYYQERARAEGYDALVPVPGLTAKTPPPRRLQSVPPQRDPRLPREPGDDDGDLPF